MNKFLFDLFAFCMRNTKKQDDINGIDEGIDLKSNIGNIVNESPYKLSYYFYDANCFGNVVLILEKENCWYRFIFDRGDIYFSQNPTRTETWVNQKLIGKYTEHTNLKYELYLSEIKKFVDKK
ncbi:hypothetical protein SDC9_53208 [bioreactor metagenome]|uniref:Uncharacterized protein n=1 Tax=bioreactor metagenome TaxID=1076179 RepID=A0A644WSL9_9ZZZZ|nr:hypothetical protein [Oscillospiraceae bacterium]